jgi:hypothetical protein
LLDTYHYTSQTISVVGTNLQDAATKLQALSDGYADARDTIMREELLFDIPILGVGIATVGSSLFKGSRDQVLALGLGAASLVGARLYFSPQGKIVAYNSAALALSCGASVASDLDEIVKSFGTGADTDAATATATKLLSAITAANNKIASPVKSASAAPARAALLTARDQAQKALTDLNSALAIIATAPGRLQVFANQVMRNTTSKIVTGSQNVDAALAAIRANATSTLAPKPSAAPSPPGSRPLLTIPDYASEDEPALTYTLQTLTADAAAYTRTINDAWSLLAGCTIN